MNSTEPGAAEGPTGGQLLANRLGAGTHGVEMLSTTHDLWLRARDPECAACGKCAGERERCLATSLLEVA